MPRPTKPRWVEFPPRALYFKPAGVPRSELQEVILGVDEVEAIRLKDYVGLEQIECAKRMNLAQSTFQRILTEARRKVAEALIEEKSLRVEGGNYLVFPMNYRCHTCGHEWTNDERPKEDIVCPKCGGLNLESFREPCASDQAHKHAGRTQKRHGHKRRRNR